MDFSNSTTFSAGQTLTASDLNSITTGLSGSNVDRDDVAADTSVITIQNGALSAPKEGEFRFNTLPGANEGMLVYYNGSHEVVVGEGIVGFNATGSTIEAGSIVSFDASATSLNDGRVPIKKCAIGERPLGVLVVEATASTSQPVVSKSFSATVLKATTTQIAKGEPVIVDDANDGEARTGNIGLYGNIFGGTCIGTALDTAVTNATLVNVRIHVNPDQTVQSYQSTPTLVFSGVISTFDSYSNSFGTPAPITLQTVPNNVVAREFRVSVRSLQAGVRDAYTELRPVGSANATANPAFSGSFLGGPASLATEQIYRLLVPMNHNETLMEFKMNEASGNTLILDIWETGVHIGGN